ncbi:MAG: ABC transporter ATP-binding protein [Bacilli bacterium]|nr:ABC transporter ATP-binding protein [Bacilli bacterium]
MFKALLKSVRQYKRDAFLSMFFILLEAIIECIMPFIMSSLIDTMRNSFTNEEMLNYVLIYSSILVVCAFASLACGILAGRMSARAGVGFAANLKEDMFKKINTFSFYNIDKFSVSSLVTRQNSDVWFVQMCFSMLIRICLRAPLMTIFSIVMAGILAPNLFWIYFITIPLLSIALFAIALRAMPMFRGIFQKYDKLNESVEENVRGIRVVKTYVREEYEKEKFDNSSDALAKNFIKAEKLVALNAPIMQAIMYLSMFLIIFLGSTIIVNTTRIEGNEIASDLTVGNLSSLITYGAQILLSINMVAMIFVMFSMSVASMRRIYEVLIEEPSIKNNENPIMNLDNGEIEFKNVSFKYSENAEKFALENVNLKINSGQMVGIVGGTGSSKSTLVSLISRFYDTTEGEVFVNGKNVKEYDLKTLRDGVSMVLQNNVLFSGTIAENLRWGNKEATDDELKEACKIAQADTFVEGFPDKYNMMIQQGGVNVSGGQKQRLCIARAILKNPKVLILDDSTSAVDTKTDALIRKGLRETLPTTTKIIIAQRINSVQDADFIIVMDDGKINGIGTHEELLKTNKIYQEIYEIQSRIGGK